MNPVLVLVFILVILISTIALGVGLLYAPSLATPTPSITPIIPTPTPSTPIPTPTPSPPPPSLPFRSEWQTNPSLEVVIVTREEYSYDYTIDWGDGTEDENVTGDITHTYSSDDVYEISISAGSKPRVEAEPEVATKQIGNVQAELEQAQRWEITISRRGRP